MNRTFWEHLEELKTTLICAFVSVLVGMGISFFFFQKIIHFLLIPLTKSGIDVEIVLFAPLEGLITSFKIAFWTGALLSSPFWSYQILRFLIPALHPSEVKLLIPFMVLSILFLILGFVFAFFFSIPLSNHYLYHFNEELGKNIWSLNEYLNYTITFLLSHCIAFEICAVLLFFVHFQVISVEAMKTKRRHVIVGALILGALLTPPDVVSQMIVGALLVGIYEIAILYGKLKQRQYVESPILN